jgi:hypothetical protein
MKAVGFRVRNLTGQDYKYEVGSQSDSYDRVINFNICSEGSNSVVKFLKDGFTVFEVDDDNPNAAAGLTQEYYYEDELTIKFEPLIPVGQAGYTVPVHRVRIVEQYISLRYTKKCD